METGSWQEAAELLCICMICCFVPVVMAFLVGGVTSTHGYNFVARDAKRNAFHAWWHPLIPVMSVMVVMCFNLVVVDFLGMTQTDQSLQSILQPLGMPSTYFESQETAHQQPHDAQSSTRGNTVSKQLEDIKKQLSSLHDTLASPSQLPPQDEGEEARESDSAKPHWKIGQKFSQGRDDGSSEFAPIITRSEDVGERQSVSSAGAWPENHQGDDFGANHNDYSESATEPMPTTDDTTNFHSDANIVTRPQQLQQQADQLQEIANKLNEIQQAQQELEAFQNITVDESNSALVGEQMVDSDAQPQQDRGSSSHPIAAGIDQADFNGEA